MNLNKLIKKLPTALQPLGQNYLAALGQLYDQEVDALINAATVRQRRAAFEALIRVMPTAERDVVQQRINAEIRATTKRKATADEVRAAMIAEAIRVLAFAGKAWMGLP